jgi:hypothetical protein
MNIKDLSKINYNNISTNVGNTTGNNLNNNENNDANNNESLKDILSLYLKNELANNYLDFFYISKDNKIEIYEKINTVEINKKELLKKVNKLYLKNLYLHQKKIDDNKKIYIIEQEIVTDIETNEKNKTGIIYNKLDKDNLFKYNITDTDDLSRLKAFIHTLNELNFIIN